MKLAVLPAVFASFVLLSACVSAPAEETAVSTGFPAPPLASLPTERGGLGVELRSAPSQPPLRGTSSVELRITDVAGSPRDGLTLDVLPWMPAHGHGAPGHPTVTAGGSGVYLVESLQFTMPGTWELRVTMRGDGGFEDHATAKLDVR